MPPPLTFLMPLHNGAATVAAAIDSVLAQTFADFEFLIIDDGSTDHSADIIRTFRDPRIRLITNEKNLGLSASLNMGLDRAESQYIARMDADDLCLPHRATAQLAYLKAHSDIAVVGSLVETFSTDLQAGEIISYPTAPATVAATLLFRSALAHPAVTFDRRALASHNLRYETTYWGAQDYALWLACVENGLHLANINDVLLRYRVHAKQLSHSMDRMQAEGTAIRSHFLHRWLGDSINTHDLTIHDAISQNLIAPTAFFLTAASQWLQKLWTANQQTPRFIPEAFGPILCGRWVAILQTAKQAGIPLDNTDHPLAPFLHPHIRATL